MQDYDLTGNFYGWRTGDGILRLRPDWVTIVLGSNMDVDNVAARDRRASRSATSTTPAARAGGRRPDRPACRGGLPLHRPDARPAARGSAACPG